MPVKEISKAESLPGSTISGSHLDLSYGDKPTSRPMSRLSNIPLRVGYLGEKINFN